MDFEKQKPISDEYRENWKRIFERREVERYVDERIAAALRIPQGPQTES